MVIQSGAALCNNFTAVCRSCQRRLTCARVSVPLRHNGSSSPTACASMLRNGKYGDYPARHAPHSCQREESEMGNCACACLAKVRIRLVFPLPASPVTKAIRPLPDNNTHQEIHVTCLVLPPGKQKDAQRSFEVRPEKAGGNCTGDISAALSRIFCKSDVLPALAARRSGHQLLLKRFVVGQSCVTLPCLHQQSQQLALARLIPRFDADLLPRIAYGCF